MSATAQFMKPSEAAKQLGVSAKALRLYEQRGLIAPSRSAAGWRTYGPVEIARVREITAFRSLGLGLAQIAGALKGHAPELEAALAAHQRMLETQVCQLGTAIERLRELRADILRDEMPSVGQLACLIDSTLSVSFELPWPWGGEPFELDDIRPLNYIIGPLGSGKTRLAQRLAESLPDAVFLGLARLTDGDAMVLARLEADPGLKSRVDQTLAWFLEDGAKVSDALVALIVELESETPAVLIIDMIEQGLDRAAQESLIVYLRQRRIHKRPLFLLTRSSAILDLAAVGSGEAIILCPANHSPPMRVAPFPGASGYEAVATCLASPEVRERTAGVIAWRRQAA